MSDEVEAKRLGEKLLLDVQVEGLSSILASLRALEDETEGNTTTTPNTPFNIPELDNLAANSLPTILELVSPPATHHTSGAGKTSLLYLIIAHAILPPSLPSIPSLAGHDAAVILIDPLHHFSVPRLASVILHLLVSQLGLPLDTLDPSIKTDLLDLTTRCLEHVHIFHPSSWGSLLSTLCSLPDYLFSRDRHRSMHRRLHSVILEDVDAFTASLRSGSSPPSATTARSVGVLSAAARSMTREVVEIMKMLSCNAVITSSSVSAKAFLSPLPASLSSEISVVRLAVRRAEVLKFAPEMSVEQAEAERSQRWDVVRRGRFECWKVVARGADGVEDGFVFRVGVHGVEIERKDGG